MACEELKTEPLNPEIIEEKARSIYEDYISILSPKEVSRSLAVAMATAHFGTRWDDLVDCVSICLFRLA